MAPFGAPLTCCPTARTNDCCGLLRKPRCFDLAKASCKIRLARACAWSESGQRQAFPCAVRDHPNSAIVELPCVLRHALIQRDAILLFYCVDNPNVIMLY